MTKRALFLCTGNSARSIMAEALLKHQAGDLFDVCSAGTRPAGVNPLTLEAIQAYGMSIDDLQSKPVEQFAAEHFDFVITLCSKASQECRHWPGSGVVINWDFPDPAENPDPLAFKRTLQEISERIKLFVLVNSKQTGSSAKTLSAPEFFKCLGDETRLVSLLLIDGQGELCVCELMDALDLPQPTISRHLATLRKLGLLLDRRQGQWVYYRIHPLLPGWMLEILRQTREHNGDLVAQALARLTRASCQDSAEALPT
jgi:ArsR family transcriptional regulator, arsenate/arsenite/antimonite-responsive transcriptional repressor / arsenate reductase (thioredoxin)